MFFALCYASRKINLKKEWEKQSGREAVETASIAVLLRCNCWKKRNGAVSWGDCAIKGDIFFFFCNMAYSTIWLYVDRNDPTEGKFERGVL